MGALTRFTPQMAQSFFLLVEQPGMLARLGAVWFAVALAAQAGLGAAETGVMVIAVLARALAVGAFGWHVQRFVGLGEPPRGAVAVGLPLKAVAWAAAFMLLETAEMAPQPLILKWAEGDANAAVYALVGKQAFQILFGSFFLLLPAIALAAKDGGPGLMERVMKGGLGVGFGYVLVSLPFVVAGHLWSEAAATLPAVVAAAVDLVLDFAAVAVTAGYFARVWAALR